MRHLIGLCCVLAASGCLRTTSYHCSDDTSCGAVGACEASGFCSIADGMCSSCRRYVEGAGSMSGTCTNGGLPDIDANDSGGTTDTPVTTDTMMTDTPVAMCPTGYVTLTGGNAGHMYKVLTASKTWPNQEADCQLTTAQSHLAIPDDLAELTALDGAAPAGRYWIGLTDAVTEMTFVTTLGVNATYLPWESGAPNNGGPGEDCVESANSAAHEINDERCTNTSQPAVCECAP